MNVDTTKTCVTIYNNATQQCAARWGAMVGFFGQSILRPHHGFPTAFTPRDPYAPGFHPEAGREYLAHTCVEVELTGEDAETIAEGAVDAACHRLELQVRETMKGKRDIPPPIRIDHGDRLYAVPLQNASGAIRVRLTMLPGGTRARIDLDLLLAKATPEECVGGCLTRIIPTLGPIVQTMREVADPQCPLKVVYVRGDLQGFPVSAIIAMGPRATEMADYFGREMVARIEEEDRGSEPPT